MARPELPLHLQFVWHAFWQLSTDRQMGMGGSGPIGFSSLDRYATRFGIDHIDEFEAFAATIAAMDDVFLAWQAERRKAETKQN